MLSYKCKYKLSLILCFERKAFFPHYMPSLIVLLLKSYTSAKCLKCCISRKIIFLPWKIKTKGQQTLTDTGFFADNQRN